MVALKVEEQKAFTEGLFIGEIFDKFLVREAEIVTWNRFSIDGKIRQGYFSEEELEENRIEEYSSWKSLKPICYSLIRGKRLPESFRIVFLMPPSARDRFVSGRVPGISPDQVGGLYINVQYENQEMICVTGTSMKQFTMDRTLENEWDENVRKFLRKNGAAMRNGQDKRILQLVRVKFVHHLKFVVIDPEIYVFAHFFSLLS